MINVLGFLPGQGMIIPIPRAAGQVITMGALVGAFGLALLLNPRVRIRPNAYLILMTAMTLLAIAGSLTGESGLGSLFRCFRLTVFVVTLWLLCRWWTGDMAFARFHLRTLTVVLSSVVLGMVISPGSAFSGAGGRLVGALWPIPPPQVGQYAAVAAGMAALMWLTGNLDGRSATLIVGPSVFLLLLSQTRTALAGLGVALAVGALSLVWSSARARRVFAGVLTAAAVVGLLFNQIILVWLQRGQDADELTSLTGRQVVWDGVLNEQRPPVERLIGIGLTNKSFNGLPIDSSWIAVYHELGLVGIAIVGVMVLLLVSVALLRPPSPARALAMFLITYCLVASYTEVGLGDASPYLMHLAVAASLLVAGATTAPGPYRPRRRKVTPSPAAG